MNENEIIDLIKEKTFDDGGKIKLSCTSAHEIGEKHNIRLSVIGDLCNNEEIKISHCQLGCFE